MALVSDIIGKRLIQYSESEQKVTNS
jgi:hypothetical protein